LGNTVLKPSAQAALASADMITHKILSNNIISLLLLLLLLLKSVEFDDDVALLLSVAGLVMGPHVTSESDNTD